MGQIRNEKKNLRLFWTGWKTEKEKENTPQHTDLWISAEAGLGEAGGTKRARRQRVPVNGSGSSSSSSSSS